MSIDVGRLCCCVPAVQPANIFPPVQMPSPRQGLRKISMTPHSGSRRRFLQAAGYGGIGLFWQQTLGRIAAAAKSKGTAKSVILIFNCGAPSHIDLWDPKPNATDT